MKILVTECEGSAETAAVTMRYETTLRYQHVFGSISPFLEGLEHGVLRATRCETCLSTFFPPRPYCPEDLEATVWYELPGTGIIATATRVHVPTTFVDIEPPYVLAILRLDGVDGSIMHHVLGQDVPQPGTRVRATSVGDNLRHPLLRVAFQIERTP